MSTEIEVGGRVWPSKKALKEFLRVERDVVRRTQRYTRRVTDPVVIAVLTELVERDPDYPGECTGFVVIPSPASSYGHRTGHCYAWVPAYGSARGFSANALIDADNKTAIMKKKCREAIRPQTEAYRDARIEAGTFFSDESGTPLSRETCHVDHVGTPFADIFAEYFRMFPKSGTPDEFAEFHSYVAQFQLLTDVENLRKGYSPETEEVLAA